MPRGAKRYAKKATLALDDLLEIILCPETNELALTSRTSADSPPTPPPPPSLPPPSDRSSLSISELDEKPKKERRINWTLEIVEQLVEVIHAKFLQARVGIIVLKEVAMVSWDISIY